MLVCYILVYHMYSLFRVLESDMEKRKTELGVWSIIQSRRKIVVLNKVDSLGFTEREKN